MRCWLIFAFTVGVSAQAVPPSTILQAAANAYAGIGQTATCAEYSTSNQGTTQLPGGSLGNLLCQLGDGSWHDAAITVQMTPAQLQASRGGTDDPTLISQDPTTQQIGQSYTANGALPTTTSTNGGSGMGVVTGMTVGSALASAACTAAGVGMSIFTFGGSTELTQVCNRIALYAMQAQQVAMMLNMVMHTQRAGGWAWGTITADLMAAASAARIASSIAYSIDPSLFARTFPGNGYQVPAGRYMPASAGWNQTALDTLGGSAGALSVRYSQIQADQAQMGMLRAYAQSANGRMAAQDVQNQVALAQLGQSQGLEATIIAAEQSRMAVDGARLQKEAADLQTTQRFFGNTNPSYSPQLYSCCN